MIVHHILFEVFEVMAFSNLYSYLPCHVRPKAIVLVAVMSSNYSWFCCTDVLLSTKFFFITIKIFTMGAVNAFMVGNYLYQPLMLRLC